MSRTVPLMLLVQAVPNRVSQSRKIGHRGRSNEPRSARFVKLARALKIPPGDHLDGIG